MGKPVNLDELFGTGKPKSITYLTEGAIIAFTEEVARRMEELGINRKELAARLGTSPAYVTKLLSGNGNFTLETMVKVATALDTVYCSHLQPAEAQRAVWHDLLPGAAKPKGGVRRNRRKPSKHA